MTYGSTGIGTRNTHSGRALWEESDIINALISNHLVPARLGTNGVFAGNLDIIRGLRRKAPDRATESACELR